MEMAKPRWAISFVGAEGKVDRWLYADNLFVENGALVFSNIDYHGENQCIAAYAPGVWSEVSRAIACDAVEGEDIDA